MTAYLDYNIIVSIDENEFSLEMIRRVIDKNINNFPYSAAHIEEIDNIEADTPEQKAEYIQNRLKCIQEITNGLYLYHELPSNKVSLLSEKPENVLETIRQVPFAKKAMHTLVNLIPFEQKKQLREEIGIVPSEINNYQPDEVVGHLNAKLTSWGTNDTLLGLLEKSIALHPDGQSFGLHNRIAGIFEFLDWLGYWKDRETEQSNLSRLWDSNHTYFASFCDYFITDDKRSRKKAQVVYDIYNISTKVLSSKGEG